MGMGDDGHEQQQGGFVGLLAGAAIIVAALSVVLSNRFKQQQNRTRRFPREPPGAWPVIGHLPLLIAKQRAHRVLAELCLKQGYGPIMGLRLGIHPAIVVSGAAAARELLSTHDKVFANRVRFTFTDHIFYGFNTSVGFSTYNPRWVQMRKLLTLELFTVKRLKEMEQTIRHDEMRKLLHRLQQASNGGVHAVHLREWLFQTAGDTAARQLFSKTLSESAPEMPHLFEVVEDEMVPTLGDFVPCLRFLDVFSRRRMDKLHRSLDKVFISIIDERRRHMANCSGSQLPNDFLQVLLSKDSAGNVAPELSICDNDIKALLLDVFTASIHTSSVTLEWALTLLMSNPECMRKLQEEVDRVAKDKDTGALLTNEDVDMSMPYLENVLKETLRLFPPAPFLLPRVSSEECHVGEYTLPKGTLAFVHAWAIARDPQIYEEPLSFRPERFEGTDLDVRGQHYELLPFGAGRRMCAGMRIALAALCLTLANLIKFFEWEKPPGETLDMHEKASHGVTKEIPLRVIPKPRHYPLPSLTLT